MLVTKGSTSWLTTIESSTQFIAYSPLKNLRALSLKLECCSLISSPLTSANSRINSFCFSFNFVGVTTLILTNKSP